MTTHHERYIYTGDEERQLDAMDHQGFTFDDMRKKLGISNPDELATVSEPTPEPFMSPSDHKPANRKAAARPQWADGPTIETPNGLPHYFNNDPPLPTENAERNRAYIRDGKWKTIGDELANKKRELIKSLADIDTDIANTTQRREDLELGHPLRGRESIRLRLLEEDRTRILAKMAEQLIDLDDL